jgi:single-strand DNA-binding protein
MSNTITVLGNLTKDPEQRTTTNGTNMASFGVADSRSKDKTLFFNVSCFDKMANDVLKFFKKGKPIFITGTFDTREYQSRDGSAKTALQVTAHSFQFVNVGGAKKATETDVSDTAEAYDCEDPFADQ